MATAVEHPYEDTLEGLARAIRKGRTDGAHRELAREILSYDHPGHTHMVGIDRQAERATFYQCADRYAISVELDAEGLAEGGPSVALFKEDAPGVRCWVKKKRNSWGWVHPRYRELRV